MTRSGIAAALICGLLALFHVASAGAQSTERKINLSAAPSLEKTIARKLLEHEAGQPVPDEAVTTDVFDLDNDGFPEIFARAEVPALCTDQGCRMRLYGLIGDDYRDLLAGTETFSPIPVDKVVLNPYRRNGYVRIRFDQTVAVFDGDRYVDAASVTPTTLDGAGFKSVCEANGELAAAIEGQNGDPATERPKVCGCIVNGYGQWGMAQGDLDFYGRYISGTIPQREETGLGKDFHRLYVAGDEIKDGCMLDAGLGYAPEFPDEAVDEAQPALQVEPFFETCAAQDWISGNGRIGSGDRALAFCSCLAGSLADAGLTQPDVDGLRQVYAGEITEDELTETQPEAISLSDNESERCLGAMPLR